MTPTPTKIFTCQTMANIASNAFPGVTVPRKRSCPSLVEQFARTRPLQPCIATTSDTIDYATFWHLVTINAADLIQQGVKSGSRVAIIADSSPAAVIVLFAVLRTGAIAVPLSTALPELRLQLVAKTCNLTCIVDLNSPSKRVSIPGVAVIFLPLDARRRGRRNESIILPEVDAQAPALIIFTSGSTGQPKGVVHSHEGISTMAQCAIEALQMVPKVRNFLFPSFGWALNLVDTFCTLASGACLCIPTAMERSYGLEDTINLLAATRISLPSSMLAVIEPSTVASLTAVVSAGEPLRSDLLSNWSSHVELFWNFGSTETLMALSGILMNKNLINLNSGRPLSGVDCYIIDENHRKVPVGQSGQLVIESAWNFIGYINDGEIQYSKCQPGGCVAVNTGDLFMQDESSGLFIHCGRIDSQLKVSGQRIDPHEIEHYLRSATADITDLAVTVASLKDSTTGPCLIAVLVLDTTKAEGESSQPRLNCAFDSLVETLPPYMIPIGALVVSTLPRLFNGKLDRRSIASLVGQRSLVDLLSLRPIHNSATTNQDSVLTDVVATVWSEVLEVDRNKIESSSNFFLLGGNSIRAMSVCKQLRKMDVQIAVSTLFLYPTLVEMVDFIHLQGSCRSEQVKPALEEPSPNVKTGPDNLHQMAAMQCGIGIEQVEDVFPCTSMQVGHPSIKSTQSTRRLTTQD
jgi:acyl-coenzyme A synthetase/AMP-(fatty) acid ligase/aryl carrier-like protein